MKLQKLEKRPAKSGKIREKCWLKMQKQEKHPAKSAKTGEKKRILLVENTESRKAPNENRRIAKPEKCIIRRIAKTGESQHQRQLPDINRDT